MGATPLETVLRGTGSEVVIGHDQPFCIIGERINPTGRKAFALELRNGNLDPVLEDVDAIEKWFGVHDEERAFRGWIVDLEVST